MQRYSLKVQREGERDAVWLQSMLPLAEQHVDPNTCYLQVYPEKKNVFFSFLILSYCDSWKNNFSLLLTLATHQSRVKIRQDDHNKRFIPLSVNVWVMNLKKKENEKNTFILLTKLTFKNHFATPQTPLWHQHSQSHCRKQWRLPRFNVKFALVRTLPMSVIRLPTGVFLSIRCFKWKNF